MFKSPMKNQIVIVMLTLFLIVLTLSCGYSCLRQHVLENWPKDKWLQCKCWVCIHGQMSCVVKDNLTCC